MKLWEKGKLFGLLNIIDIIVILLVVAAVVGVGAKTSVLRKMTAKSTVSLVRTQVFIDDILPESAAVPQVRRGAGCGQGCQSRGPCGEGL